MNNYSKVLMTPGVKAMVFSGSIARLPQAMIGLGIITMLSEKFSNYWLTGTVAFAFMISNAFISPKVSKIIDRRGQAQVLPIATTISIVMLTALIIATQTQTPISFYFVFAFLAGVMPNITALMRARWTKLYRNQQQLLHTALALDSVITEIAYLVGPALAVALSTAISPAAGLIAAITLLAIGTMLFIAQKQTEPKIIKPETNLKSSTLTIPSLRIVVLVLIGMGMIGGAVDVAVVALTKTQGSPTAASYILAFYALGSLVSGLIFGAIKTTISIEKQFIIGISISALSTFIPILATNVYFLTAALFAAGLSFSPTMVVIMNIGTIIIPPSKLTEGLTWMTTGIGAGVALGSAITGPVVDLFGARTGFAVPIFAAAIVLLIAITGLRTLRASSQFGMLSTNKHHNISSMEYHES